MSASGVVSIDFAKISFVLLSTISSEILSPFGNDLIEMLKDDLANFTTQARRTVVLKLVNDIETIRMQPVLALCISLHRMDMHRVITLIRVKMEPPTLNIK